MARAAELAATPVLAAQSFMTAEAREAREGARYCPRDHLRSTRPRKIDQPRRIPLSAEALTPGQPASRSRAPRRALACLDRRCRRLVDRAWRDTPAQERAFNAACRAMGWFKPGENGAGHLCRADRASALGLDIGGAPERSTFQACC